MSGPIVPTPMDHCYDGIQEYDNPTPGWWWMLFWVTILFSVVYFTFFQFSPVAWTAADELDADAAEILRLQFAEIGDLEPDAPTLLKYMADKEWLAFGKRLFANQCAKCHGPDAAGLVGPNLTDNLYKNVNTIEDIASVVTNGANNNAMPRQKGFLHPNEIVMVSAYVASLRGQNLPSGAQKPLEGEKEIPPWPAPPPPPPTQQGE